MLFEGFGGEMIQAVVDLPWLTFPLSIIAPMVGGEVAVLALAFLSGQGFIPLWPIIIGSFIGMLLLDIFWVGIPRLPLVQRLRQRGREISEKYRALESRIEYVSNKNDILILFISKILIGTRILILAYLSVRNISFSRFLISDSIATLLWAVMLGYIGKFAGAGYYTVRVIYDNIFITALYLVVVVVVLYALLLGIKRWLVRM